MLLRESLRLGEAATLLEAAVEDAWRRGFRTFDVLEPGATLVGTEEMGARVVESIARLGARQGKAVLAR
jgi:3-isopropylmalate dehydrogenase